MGPYVVDLFLVKYGNFLLTRKEEGSVFLYFVSFFGLKTVAPRWSREGEMSVTMAKAAPLASQGK